MANLIIKSSANDLVIQGSDESPAITVGTTGTTTFAENATLSGTANNLGTVTGGTLSHGTILQGYVDASNTGVTFPAGHVLQTQVKQNESNSMENSSTTTPATSSQISLAITTKKANSKILFRGTSFWAHCQDTAQGEVHLQSVITGGATTQLGEDDLISMYNNRAAAGSSNSNNYEPLTLEYMDSPGVAAGTEITYSTRYARNAGGNDFYYVHTGGGVLVIIQEIAV